jgi:protoporphyrinogen oxidase
MLPLADSSPTQRGGRHYAIIGAGVAGLTAAYRLLQQGQRVTVFEKSPFVGGQLATTVVGGVPIEHYYHHTFTSDADLLMLCEELGITDKMMWIPSTMGYFSQGKLYPFGTPKSILTFRPLGIFAKIGFVLSTLWITFVMKPAYAEKHTVHAWFLRYGFGRVWDIVWKPLFQLKFAADADRISLIWLWGKLHTRGTSRNGSKEVLGYMKGSFGALAVALSQAIEGLGGELVLGTELRSIKKINQDFVVESSAGTFSVDAVISTQAANQLVHSYPWSSETTSYLNGLEYKSAICVMVISDRRWFDRYWINIGDENLPFGGIVEHTNWVPAGEYGGKHVMYLSRYLEDDDSLFTQPDTAIVEMFCNGINVILTDFDRSLVQEIRVFRQRNAQPVVPKGYIAPSMLTEIPDFYWISTHHTYPFDRGINYAIRLANRLVGDISAQ